MNSVFCKFCKYFKVISTWEYCKSPKNITLEKNYYKPYKEYHKLPKDINKNNKCEWYELGLYIRILGFLQRIIIK